MLCPHGGKIHPVTGVYFLTLTAGGTRGGVRGGREGALAPPDLPNFFFFFYIYIYFFMCVVVKGGDLIEIVINSA